MKVMRLSRAWLFGCCAYAVLVAALTLDWSRGTDGFNLAEAATFLISFPVSLMTLPLSYAVLATAWKVTGADEGGPMWLVVLTYAAWFAAVAVANLVLATVVVRTLRKPRPTVARSAGR